MIGIAAAIIFTTCTEIWTRDVRNIMLHPDADKASRHCLLDRPLRPLPSPGRCSPVLPKSMPSAAADSGALEGRINPLSGTSMEFASKVCIARNVCLRLRPAGQRADENDAIRLGTGKNDILPGRDDGKIQENTNIAARTLMTFMLRHCPCIAAVFPGIADDPIWLGSCRVVANSHDAVVLQTANFKQRG